MAKEFDKYQIFTEPAQLHKAVNTLRGIIAGITTDENVSDSEMAELIHWCELHSHLRNRHPFSELLPVVENACSDGVITSDESKDILWLCSNFIDDSSYYDTVTSSIQFLSGLIHGIMADGTLGDKEINSLKAWMDANDFLTGTYPFDEINSLLYSILEDKVITEEERRQLVAFLSNFIEFKDSLNLCEKDYAELRGNCQINGICALCPEIQFSGRVFCFTGEFSKGKRNELEKTVLDLGGVCRSSISSKVDYLIVGNAGNPCWAYACYGRKIEEAIALRKSGGKIMIINETDFWDAVEDALAGIAD